MSATRVNQILTDLLSGRGHEGSLAQRLCVACAVAVPVDDAAMALLTTRGSAGLVGATSERARAMEDLQLVTGEGPCVDASRLRRPVLEPELRRTAPTRWLGFAPAALEAGVGAIFAFPLQVGGIRLGVLDLYRTAAGPLDDDGLSRALSYADAAVLVLLHLQDQTPLDGGLPPDLAAASTQQFHVHQATGMVAVQAGVGLTEALLLLRGRAYSSGRSIVGVAGDVLAHTLRFEPEGRGDDAGRRAGDDG